MHPSESYGLGDGVGLGVGDGLGGGDGALVVGCGVGLGDGLPGCGADGCRATTRVRLDTGVAPATGAAVSLGRACGRTALCGLGRTRVGGDGFMPVDGRDGLGGAVRGARVTAAAALIAAAPATSCLTGRQATRGSSKTGRRLTL